MLAAVLTMKAEHEGAPKQEAACRSSGLPEGATRSAVEMFAEAIADDTVDGDVLLPLALEIHHLAFDSLTEPQLMSLLSTMRDVGNMSQVHVDSCLRAYWKRKATALITRLNQFNRTGS